MLGRGRRGDINVLRGPAQQLIPDAATGPVGQMSCVPKRPDNLRGPCQERVLARRWGVHGVTAPQALSVFDAGAGGRTEISGLELERVRALLVVRAVPPLVPVCVGGR